MGGDFFKWEEVYNTNITSIDTQHKVIIKILNELYDVVLVNKQENKLSDILNELVQYTIYHFREEEKLFDKYGFTEEKEHRAEHQDFIEKVKEFGKTLEKEEGFLVFDLIEFLKDWLIDHIMITDQKYVVFFKDKGIIV